MALSAISLELGSYKVSGAVNTLDFVKDYCAYVPARVRESHVISGSDAYAVLKVLLQSEVDTDMEMGI